MDETKLLIIGINGQLGSALRKKYPRAQTTDVAQLDITDKQAVDNFNWQNVDCILNAAAYTDVDGAETDTGRQAAWSINAVGVANIVNAAIKNDITMVHVSTDYVFDGRQEVHAENEQFSPLNVYGQSKAAGDIAVSLTPKQYVLRTSWLIGEGKNFVRTMLSLGKQGISPQVVNDQIGRLTFTNVLVEAMGHLLETHAPYGTYNVSCSGDSVSWAAITREIFEDAGFEIPVKECSTAEYFSDKENWAPRPMHSTLLLEKVEKTGFQLVDWREALKEYVRQESKT